mmetsp:Transcript_4888/g.14054  ORF Transcript_4888/g.14054 Transcript_4888/m.14054 type:complete len:272 (+) Transcript_4888:316-1131(+)
MRCWMRGLATSIHVSSVALPRRRGPGVRPSSSYTAPSKGTYDTKWNASSSSVALRSSVAIGSGGWKLLWTRRMVSEFPMACPRISAGKSAVNSLSDVRSGPISISGRLSRTDRIAWVAHAFGITCCAKNTRLSSAAAGGVSKAGADWYLNRNTSPCTGWRACRASLSREYSSSTCTSRTPISCIRAVNTPGSDSIVDHDSSMYVPCCATSLSFTASLQVGNIGGFCLTLSLMKHTGDTASACHTQHCLAMFCWPAISEVLVMRSRGVFRKR